MPGRCGICLDRLFVPEKLADKIDAIYASMHFERCFLPDEYEGTPMEAEHVLDDRIKALEAEKQEVEGKILQTLDENKKRAGSSPYQTGALLRQL